MLKVRAALRRCPFGEKAGTFNTFRTVADADLGNVPVEPPEPGAWTPPRSRWGVSDALDALAFLAAVAAIMTWGCL